MSGNVFHPGGMVHSEHGLLAEAQLAPGEKVVPLSVLTAHWDGDSTALAGWVQESALTRAPEARGDGDGHQD